MEICSPAPKLKVSSFIPASSRRLLYRSRFLPNDDATFQYMINDTKFLNEMTHLLLEPEKPLVMRRSSSLTILEHQQYWDDDDRNNLSQPLRHRTSSLNYQEKIMKTRLRKRPSERNFNEMEIEMMRHIEWNYRKQDIDFPSSSITLSAVSPKGKRCDTLFLENSELLCRFISGVLKGYIETASHSDDGQFSTPKGHRYNIFENSSPKNNQFNSDVEILDLTKIINPASQILEKRKFRRAPETPTLNEIFKFIHNIFIQTQMESECLLIALVYIERAVYGANFESFNSEPSSNSSTPPPQQQHLSSSSTICRTPSPGQFSDGGTDSPMTPTCHPIETLTLSAGNWKAIVITALLLASKIWDDFSMINSDFANICYLYGCNIDVQRLNELEKSFLVALDYRVFVKGPEYSQVYFRLQSIMDRVRGWMGDKSNPGKRQRQSNSPASKNMSEDSKTFPLNDTSPPQSHSLTIIPTIANQQAAEETQKNSRAKMAKVEDEEGHHHQIALPPPPLPPLPTLPSTNQVPIGTLMSRNLFESIYSWIDDQLLTPTPTTQSTPSPSKTSLSGEAPLIEYQIPASPLRYYPSTDIPYSLSSPFVTHPRRRATSMPATIAPSSLPFVAPSLSSSLSESISTSDLFGTLVLDDMDNDNHNDNHNGDEQKQNTKSSTVNNKDFNCLELATPNLFGSVMGILEKGIIQYQKATELGDEISQDVEFL